MKATTPTHGAATGTRHSRIRNAFTLIELLVVVAIVGILASMSAVVYSSAINKAKETRTKAMLVDVVTAIKGYQLEYNRLPLPDGYDEATELVFDGDSGGTDILKALIGDTDGNIKNPRGIVFLEPETSNGVDLGVVFTGDDNPEKLLDAWGQPVKIIMDSDYDSKVDDPDPAETNSIRKPVIIWSDGSESRESSDNPWRNNIKSWD